MKLTALPLTISTAMGEPVLGPRNPTGYQGAEAAAPFPQTHQ